MNKYQKALNKWNKLQIIAFLEIDTKITDIENPSYGWHRKNTKSLCKENNYDADIIFKKCAKDRIYLKEQNLL